MTSVDQSEKVPNPAKHTCSSRLYDSKHPDASIQKQSAHSQAHSAFDRTLVHEARQRRGFNELQGKGARPSNVRERTLANPQLENPMWFVPGFRDLLL